MMETTQNYLFVALKLLGALGLLIYGMKMMSEALQKLAGPQLRYILSKMTTNRFTGMLTGTLATCAVQSSSATTVGRTADAGTGHQYHHGSEHRNDADGVDHVAGL